MPTQPLHNLMVTGLVAQVEQVVQQPLHKLVQVVNQGLTAKEAAQVVAVLFS
jgi:hypothetical protein